MSGSRQPPEPLDLEEAFNPSPEVARGFEKNRPEPMSLVEFGWLMKQIHFTDEQLDSIPLTRGDRFTLD